MSSGELKYLKRPWLHFGLNTVCDRHFPLAALPCRSSARRQWYLCLEIYYGSADNTLIVFVLTGEACFRSRAMNVTGIPLANLPAGYL